MNSVKIAYMIISLIWDILLIAFAVCAPIYITPGWYVWTAFALILLIFFNGSIPEKMKDWGI